MLAVSRASATTFAANWIAPSTRQGWGSSFARAMSTNPAGQRFAAGGVPLTRVFSFGSNSVAQLRARVNAQHLDSQAAEVRDWVRIFCMHSTNWGGAVASIVPKPGGMCKSKFCGSSAHSPELWRCRSHRFLPGIVRGLVVSLTAEQMQLLDGFERGYGRTTLTAIVECPGNSSTTEDVVAYIANDATWTGMPSEAYLTAIHVMLREHWAGLAEPIAILGCEGAGGEARAMEQEPACATEMLPSDRPEASDIVEKASPWEHPGVDALGLEALCVEINARLVRQSWVMPRACVETAAALAEAGIQSTHALSHALGAGEASPALRGALCAAGGEQEEVLEVCRDLLGAALVFTYGSLLSGLSNHSHISSSTLILPKAETSEHFSLVACSPAKEYPYALELADSRPSDTACALKGEVYVVDAAVLQKLDWLEDHPNLYCRRRVQVKGLSERAWLYVLASRDSRDCVRALVKEHPEVKPMGDWRSFVAN